MILGVGSAQLERRVQVERIRVEGTCARHARLSAVASTGYPCCSQRNDDRTPGGHRVFQQDAPTSLSSAPEPIEVERIVSVVEKANRIGMSFEESMKFGLQAALVSPEFLFRLERQDGPSVRPGVKALNAHDLASRISYFLWSGPPTKRCLTRPTKENSSTPCDVKRWSSGCWMTRDRFRSFKDSSRNGWGCAIGHHRGGRQALSRVVDRLRASMAKETELFCKHL